MTRLEALADAIKSYEGWYPLSRSWRNNNPGNLRSSPFQSGTAGGFARFSSYTAGWLALWWDLLGKCTGKTRTGLTPKSTLYELISVWAPVSDGNDPMAYTNYIIKRLEVPASAPLSYFLEDMF